MRFGVQLRETESLPLANSSNMSTVENATADEHLEDEADSGNTRMLFNVVPSWMISFVGHILLIIILALMVLPRKKELNVGLEASATPTESVEAIDLDMADFEDAEMEELTETVMDEVEPVEVETLSDLAPLESLEVSEFVGAEEMVFEESTTGDFSSEVGGGSETGAREGAGKASALAKYGGTSASEEAVELGLKWIVKHQLPDGGWNFDHTLGPGQFRDSPDPGELSEARMGATAMALLPLLGNGQTHQVGKYKDNVRAGLDFLMKNAKRGGNGISYHEKGGTMYSHGLVAIVFCEAFAMTEDPKLAPFAQGTIWFIEEAQDPAGGGWRYKPKERGDTSAVGWQVMALKSAKLSGLSISDRTWKLVDKFLTNVSNTNGSFYGYLDAPDSQSRISPSLTSIGLLCRMYMKWEKDTPGLIEGVAYLDKRGPSTGDGTNMYYNYYATQIMKQYGGKEWTKWNGKMRDYLVKTQNKEGNATGSWFLGGSKGHSNKRGGRLYSTAMATMTLEVYYRFLPIYSDKSVSDNFEL